MHTCIGVVLSTFQLPVSFERSYTTLYSILLQLTLYLKMPDYNIKEYSTVQKISSSPPCGIETNRRTFLALLSDRQPLQLS